jgi:tRNA pseudouridine55 synthase
VVARVRRLAGTRKVGHAGTLDPMATGVLLIGVNRATRLLGHLALTDKSYEATIRLGQSTLTDDAEGEVTAAIGMSDLDPAALADAVAGLTGALQQVPSSVSAIKQGGVRSYVRVRSGEQVTLPARPVTVTRFAVLRQQARTVDGVPVVDLDVAVDCSTGTYVRALARDLGAALGSGAHLTRLRRTRVGAFGLAEAQSLEEAAAAGLRRIELPDLVRRQFSILLVNLTQERSVRHGATLPDTRLPAPLTALLTPAGGEFLALYRQVGEDAVPEAVFVG